jgi:hypothetical protein
MDTLDDFVIDTWPPFILLPDFCLKSSFDSRTEIKKKKIYVSIYYHHRTCCLCRYFHWQIHAKVDANLLSGICGIRPIVKRYRVLKLPLFRSMPFSDYNELLQFSCCTFSTINVKYFYKIETTSITKTFIKILMWYLIFKW